MGTPAEPGASVIFDDAAAAALTAEHAWRDLHPFVAGSAPRDARAERFAQALDALAGALEARRADILRISADETALLEAELAPEFARMTGTLRMFAGVVRAGTWRRAAHDPPASPPALAVGPNFDLRSELVPLGPVAVFGASNFPLAYGVCGGDTASALAAGCPVVIKEHPAHPRTGRLIARIAGAAVETAGLPGGVFGYVLHENPSDFSVAERLVRHPAIRAVGFTGSERGGMALDRLARERTDAHGRPDPIPVFAEMGSANPVFITPGAMATSADAIADMLASSILLRHGQQCTCPGLVFVVDDAASDVFMARLRERFAAAPGREMLTPWIAHHYHEGISAIEDAERVHLEHVPTGMNPPRVSSAMLWSTTLEEYSAHHRLHGEVFGPSVVVVRLADWGAQADAPLRGSLTLSVFADADDPADLGRARDLAARHAHGAGRIILNGVPTGVRACEAMVHGGPFPATNRPDTTAVGPRAMERWCRPVCWQNWPEAL
ncbi:MAG: aldehyde dehydrogenase family protein [Phycisphaerales bacterium]